MNNAKCSLHCLKDKAKRYRLSIDNLSNIKKSINLLIRFKCHVEQRKQPMQPVSVNGSLSNPQIWAPNLAVSAYRMLQSYS